MQGTRNLRALVRLHGGIQWDGWSVTRWLWTISSMQGTLQGASNLRELGQLRGTDLVANGGELRPNGLRIYGIREAVAIKSVMVCTGSIGSGLKNMQRLLQMAILHNQEGGRI